MITIVHLIWHILKIGVIEQPDPDPDPGAKTLLAIFTPQSL